MIQGYLKEEFTWDKQDYLWGGEWGEREFLFEVSGDVLWQECTLASPIYMNCSTLSAVAPLPFSSLLWISWPFLGSFRTLSRDPLTFPIFSFFKSSPFMHLTHLAEACSRQLGQVPSPNTSQISPSSRETSPHRPLPAEDNEPQWKHPSFRSLEHQIQRF